MATRGRPPYQVPPLPEEAAGVLQETVGEILKRVTERDGKQAYQFHPLQIVAVVQSECYKMMEEWRQRGDESWQKFFRQAGDRCGNALPEIPKDEKTDFLKPQEVWPGETDEASERRR